MEDLLDVEAMMIAPVHTVMSCYNLKGHGQMFYGRYVVALPQDITRLVNAVPSRPRRAATLTRTCSARRPYCTPSRKSRPPLPRQKLTSADTLRSVGRTLRPNACAEG
jgi:hypothetical protein